MLHTLLSVVITMAAGLKDIIETDKVTFYIGIGVRYAISYACLCGKVHHDIGMMLREDFPYEGLVGNVSLDKVETGITFQLLQTPILEGDVIVIGDGVNTYHMNITEVFEEAFDQIAADEACRSRDKDGLAVQVYIVFYHVISILGL